MPPEEDRYIRTPLTGIIRKSPLDGLLAHAEKVEECIHLLKEDLEAYWEEDYARFDELAKKIGEAEHEADLIKSNIRAHLPRNVLLVVEKSHFLTCLREEDAILDYTEDVSIWLGFRKGKIPDEIKEEFFEHLERVIECVEAYERAIKEAKGIIGRTSREEGRKKVKDAIKETHRKEWEADEVERSLTKKIFELDMEPLAKFHLIKVVGLIGEIANHTENAGDWLRVMIAR
jgi:hypothetical protein